MAIVGRSERTFLPILEGTSPTVGPGSYLRSEMDLGVGMKYSVAPFCSTTRRVFGGNDEKRMFQTPGPGSYHQGGVKSGFKDDDALGPSSNFVSRSRRFDEGTFFEYYTPGPGAYETSAKTISNEARRRNERNQQKERGKKKKQSIEYIKVFSTPSIPNKPKGKKDSPGPAEYNVTKKRKFKNMSSTFVSRTGRNAFGIDVAKRAKQAPGPGAYNNRDEEDMKEHHNITRPGGVKLDATTSSFASKSKRFNNFLGGSGEKKVLERPGPGKYLSINHHSSFVRSRRKPDRFQNFGSSSLRFGRPKSITPGPGYFFQDVIGDGQVVQMPHHPSQQFYRRNFHPPFLSSQKRFQPTGKERELVKMQQAPPQTETQIMETKINEERKVQRHRDLIKSKRLAPQAPFNSTSKRFLKNRKDFENPGVGNYDISREFLTKARKKKKKKKMKKKKKRLNLRKPGHVRKPMKYETPGPGMYNINRISSFGKMKNTTRFQGESRFKMKKNSVPGPGAYSNYDTSFSRKGYRMGKKKKSIISKKSSDPATELRKMRNLVPGPGYYDVLDQWDKKTFNVMVTQDVLGGY